jgi:hypothetical protein
MLWLRQMGLAAVALVGTSVAFGVVAGAAEVLVGRPSLALTSGPIGGALQVASVVVGLVIAHRAYLAIERWDAIRSGHIPQG